MKSNVPAELGRSPEGGLSLRRRDVLAALGAGTAAVAFPFPAWSMRVGQGDFSLAMAGDIIYLRPSLPYIEADSAPLLDALRSADVTFGNFESGGFALEDFPGTHRGPEDGPIFVASPAAMADLRKMGFDLFSTANNHAYDWYDEGVRRTGLSLQQEGFTFTGSGESLAQARKFAVHDAGKAKVALVATTTSLPHDARAQDADSSGGKARAGVASLRFQPVEGKSGSDDHDGGPETAIDAEDLAALLGEVAQARQSADIVMFSLHSHQRAEPSGIEPPRFHVDLARAVIDAGADVVVVHGPHQLRGIEIYKGKAIFYSLSNFAIMLPEPALNPTPLEIPPGSFFTQRVFFESMIPTARFRDGKIHEIELLPFEMRNTGQLETQCIPQAVSAEVGEQILARVETMCQAFGTKVERRGGLGIISLG